MPQLRQRHIFVGGNRHPAAADWRDGLLAFGSGKNVAVWHPDGRRGVKTLLRGHTDAVSAIRIISTPGRPDIVVSGSADTTVRIWTAKDGQFAESFKSHHDAAVNTIAVLPDTGVIITGAADATLKIWNLSGQDGTAVHLAQTITLKPRFLPLATTAVTLDDGSVLFAVGGTSTIIQLYHGKDGQFELAATLTGHEGWLRSLDFVRESTAADSDILLASASQDRYIRLWRIHRGEQLPTASAASQDPSLGVLGRSLSNRPHFIGKHESLHSVTFEALLIGHEDWIYTAQWKKAQDAQTGPELLSTSADNSVSIWKREADSGFWVCQTRLGEISVQKGSTTATGSTGGFWIGMWSPSGSQIASLGRTGSWKIWEHIPSSDHWEQRAGISGHIKEVRSLAWSSDGSYLLSTGADQTTRLTAPWSKDEEITWHEVARPQIHGYDLNCVDSLGTTQFVSGADEKLLRVFNKPKSTATLLGTLSGNKDLHTENLPEIANIPVLGLSNKAMTAKDAEEDGSTANATDADESIMPKEAAVDIDHPPHEDLLSRYTLWPEHEKLYGHGYEISALAASNRGELVATACRASSIDHAVIRLYETKDWREIRPALSGHSLTVTSLAFSPSDEKLLSVGRDRQWIVFQRKAPEGLEYEVHSSNPKGHSRMILDCSWAPVRSGEVFATAGRDKSVKVWALNEDGKDYSCKLTIPVSAAATAVAFGLRANGDRVLLASGSEDGEVTVSRISLSSWSVESQSSLADMQRPAGAITSLRWRPHAEDDMLAVASEDHSVRLYEME